MKDASDWVRLCWVAWSRAPILEMKVCLLGQVTAMPSISFRNLRPEKYYPQCAMSQNIIVIR